MRYNEISTYKASTIALLVLVFIIILSPWQLGLKELAPLEGVYSALASAINPYDPSTIAHGETLSYFYPMFPLLGSFFYKLGLSLTVGLRIISVLSLAGLGVLVFLVGRKVANMQVAVVAVAVTISNFIMLENALVGLPDLLGVLLLYIAWAAWYTYGAVRGNWDLAWIISCLFCGLAFYTIGWDAIIFFFLPLIFMRRPLTLWPKLKTNGFWVGVWIILFFILIWFIPRIINEGANPFRSFSPEISKNYISQYFIFPFSVAAGLLPWTIILWPSFCMDYFQLDNNRLFSRYLRTIVYSLFALFWLLCPFVHSRHLMILVPAIGIMTGLNYWLLIRRHGDKILKILKFCISISIIIACFCLLLFLIPFNWWQTFVPLIHFKDIFLSDGISFLKTQKYFGIIQTSFAILIGIYLLFFFKKRRTVWFSSLGMSLMLMLCVWSVSIPYSAQQSDVAKIANVFKESLGKDYSKNLIVYEGPRVTQLYTLGCYLGTRIKKIHNINELPKDKKTIYLLSTKDMPVYPAREWSIVATKYYKERSLCLWKGTIVNEKGSS